MAWTSHVAERVTPYLARLTLRDDNHSTQEPVYPNSTSTSNQNRHIIPSPRMSDRIRSQIPSRTPTCSQVESILRARFPKANISVITSAAMECTQLFEGDTNIRPLQSLPSSNAIRNDGFLRRIFPVNCSN
jgi:hypothetical protein